MSEDSELVLEPVPEWKDTPPPRKMEELIKASWKTFVDESDPEKS